MKRRGTPCEAWRGRSFPNNGQSKADRSQTFFGLVERERNTKKRLLLCRSKEWTPTRNLEKKKKRALVF